MRSIHVPADQLEGQYQVFRGESNEGAILLRMERKYRRLLYHNRIPFFDKCSIDSEARPIVLKYRAEYGVHAYKNCQRDAKNCWWNRSLEFIKSTNQRPFSGPPIFFKKILVVLWVMVRVVTRFPSSPLIHNKNNIINIFGTVELKLTPLFVLVSTKGIHATFKYYYSYSQQKYKISF